MGFPTSGLSEGYVRKHSDGRRWKWRASKGVWQIKHTAKSEAELVGDTGSTGPQGIQGPPGPAGESAEGSKVIWRGWQGHHSQSNGWGTPTLNWHDIPVNTDYATISGTKINIVKAGYYDVFSNVMQHKTGDGWRHSKILVNGSAKTNDYYDHYASSWLTANSRHSQWFNVGDYIEWSMYISGGNPYRWHGGSYHTYAILTFLGDEQ